MYLLNGNQLSLVASTYGSSTYDNSVYNNPGSVSSTSSSGILANTGFIVLTVVIIAVVIIFVALLVHFFRKSDKPKVSPPGASGPDDHPNS